ncbi:transcriptional regulator [Enterococcus florum]|uniref:Transcriptional regulator n=1 Tax=Enterococcus florum TaxID=2480627 RepID=A0A4V0WPR5_9ENTE|nr:YutD family protein [Enterococcus florum]GCF94779.1 transcriptional regulator [Enterococcus florum]
MTTKEEKTVTEELTEVLEEIVETPEEKKKGETVTRVDETTIMIGERQYKIVADYREGFDGERLGERFSDVLSRYDYIVGDWGYDQLRLKGFFRADDRKSNPEQRIDTLEDYLYEYCNFGCAYFVIERIGGKRYNPNRKKRKKRRKTNNQAHIEEKKAPVKEVRKETQKKKPVIQNRKPKKEAATKTKQKDGRFVIRQREE